jgi:Rod binding domain-containing protein
MNPVSGSLPTIPPEASISVAAPRGMKAAQEFEENLIASLLASMEKTFANVPGGDLPGSDDYNYLGTQALSTGIVARGGFGIARLITRYLSTHEGKGPGDI